MDKRAELVEGMLEAYRRAMNSHRLRSMMPGVTVGVSDAEAMSAALDLALEEAARLADERASLPATSDRIHDAGWNNASISIAAAIRALKSKP